CRRRRRARSSWRSRSYASLRLLANPVFCRSRAPTHIYALSLHDALPISQRGDHRDPERLEPRQLLGAELRQADVLEPDRVQHPRSEEHTSELQSRFDLVCRLLLEKKKGISYHGSSKPRRRGTVGTFCVVL